MEIQLLSGSTIECYDGHTVTNQFTYQWACTYSFGATTIISINLSKLIPNHMVMEQKTPPYMHCNYQDVISYAHKWSTTLNLTSFKWTSPSTKATSCTCNKIGPENTPNETTLLDQVISVF